jgi:plastocyanin
VTSSLVASVLVAVVAPTPASAASSAGTFFPLPPVRILDTRVGIGAGTSPVGPDGVLSFKVTANGGVPATDVSAVVLNMTVVGATATSYLTVWPTGQPMPTASNLNYVAGQTVPNLVKAKVGAGGMVSVYNAFGSVHVLADVAGFYRGGSDPIEGSRYNSVNPARILDTRTGNGAPAVPIGANQSIDLQVAGQGGLPGSGVAAVALNVTAVGPTAASYLTAWPTGEQRPNASNLNYVAGDVVPNLVIVKVGANGKVSLYNESGSVHVLADVVGWYSAAGGAGEPYVPLNPSRILDTRTGNGAPLSPVGPAQTLNLQVLDRGGVPASGVAAVVLNVTAVSPTSSSYLTAWPAGESQPNASNLNYRPGQVVPNLVVVKVGTGGLVSLFNELGQVHVIADVVGWFGAGPPLVEVARSVAAGDHVFIPSNIVAPAGARVTMTFTNPDVELHTFTSPAVGVDQALDPGGQVVFTFIMPATATSFVCTIHQLEGMVGTLTPG